MANLTNLFVFLIYIILFAAIVMLAGKIFITIEKTKAEKDDSNRKQYIRKLCVYTVMLFWAVVFSEIISP